MIGEPVPTALGRAAEEAPQEEQQQAAFLGLRHLGAGSGSGDSLGGAAQSVGEWLGSHFTPPKLKSRVLSGEDVEETGGSAAYPARLS